MTEYHQMRYISLDTRNSFVCEDDECGRRVIYVENNDAGDNAYTLIILKQGDISVKHRFGGGLSFEINADLT